MDRQKYSFIREIPFYDPRSLVTYAQDSMFKALFSILRSLFHGLGTRNKRKRISFDARAKIVKIPNCLLTHRSVT